MIASAINKSSHIIGYRRLNKLNKFIKTHKDKEPRTSNNNVIYKIACKDCNASYVGQTKTQLKTRLREHMNNIRQDYSKHIIVSEHIVNFNQAFDWESVQILDHEHNYYKRLISEMIYIMAMLAASVLPAEHNNFCNKLCLSQIRKSFSRIKA